jgi:hypothetical protein
MSGAFQGQYLNYKNSKTDDELKLFQVNRICVDQKIVHKSVVQVLWKA